MFKSVRITNNKKTTVKEWNNLNKAIAYAKRWSTTANHVLTEIYDEGMNLVFSTNSVEAVPVEVVEEDYTEQHKAETNIMSGADAMTLNERLADYGSFALTDAELLSVVTHVKPENFKGVELPLLLSDPELYVKGIGKKKRQLLNVVKELASRLQAGAIANKVPVNNSTVAAKLLADYQYDTREHFLAILLTVKNTVIKIEEISVGSLSASIVHPREVFFAAIKYHAASVIVAHNHPSGFTSPSREDCQVTKRLVKAGKILDIPILDHIIVGNGTHFSFKDRCMLE